MYNDSLISCYETEEDGVFIVEILIPVILFISLSFNLNASDIKIGEKNTLQYKISCTIFARWRYA